MLLSLALSSSALAQYSPGSRSLGDRLLPALGNGGYDVQHYDLAIDYDPVANTMTSTAGIDAIAKQNLSELSLDFRGMTVTAVTVDGAPAAFAREGDKLVIRPAAGIANNAAFDVDVAYTGMPQEVEDPDESLEGWLRTPDGAFVVNEPMGAMAWFPNNDHPLDKATYDVSITVPSAKTALSNGELVSRTDHPNGTSTWHWRESFPMATYLSTATVGDFDYTAVAAPTALGASGAALQLYNAIDSSYPANTKSTVLATLAREDQITSFMSSIYGAYPFDSIGAVVDRLSGVGYVLEVQTKIHFPTSSVSAGTLSHEISHQWFGDSVSLKQWEDIWLNEGWATWSQWNWSNRFNGGATPAATFTTEYNRTSQPSRWNIPTADLPSAANLFDTFPVYTRGAMTLEALHQIIGDAPFMELARTWQAEHRYGNADTAEFIALAKRIARDRAGFDAIKLAKLDTLFQQWLYTPGKPTMTPTTFFQRTDADGSVGGTVPATLALSLSGAASFAAFRPGLDNTYTAETTAKVTSTAGDAALTVSDPGHLANGAFTLPEPLQVQITPAAWTAPVSNATVAIAFKQHIGATDALRTGTYAKTLTFTLSTTNP
ncbi:M1 family metallopeptidase [Candidatus Solirubrobacter pratensis]|uniref:M1 family metallopeptidase n=1 Tax=Candidatus Solirubrobacter pratensis TaxID=1298857 RepID=UPI000427A7B4|nr:M1 family metallopeptidase [Candidatus Solirubrobacter pratensis]